MILEIVIYAFIYYLFIGISYYVYSVLKYHEHMDIWNFSIKDSVVGVYKCPKFLVFWIEWIYSKIKRGK